MVVKQVTKQTTFVLSTLQGLVVTVISGKLLKIAQAKLARHSSRGRGVSK